MLQWTPGAGVENVMHPRWWPYYHKTIEAGKKLIVGGSREEIVALKREFGTDLKQFLISTQVGRPEELDEILDLVSC